MSEKTSPSEKPVPGDDRNLIPAAAAASGPTIEERIMEFWRRNRGLLLAVVVVGLVAIGAREALRFFDARKEAAARDAFGAATTTEARLGFAREHAGHALAGFALLAVADEAYAAGDFAEAGRRYAAAAPAVKDSALAARARLGEAMAALQQGEAANGERLLSALAVDETAPKALRFEARFHLASAALATGDTAKSAEHLDGLDALEPEGMWAARSGALRARLPAQDGPAPLSVPGLAP